jgi:hypothetical protein
MSTSSGSPLWDSVPSFLGFLLQSLWACVLALLSWRVASPSIEPLKQSEEEFDETVSNFPCSTGLPASPLADLTLTPLDQTRTSSCEEEMSVAVAPSESEPVLAEAVDMEQMMSLVAQLLEEQTSISQVPAEILNLQEFLDLCKTSPSLRPLISGFPTLLAAALPFINTAAVGLDLLGRIASLPKTCRAEFLQLHDFRVFLDLCIPFVHEGEAPDIGEPQRIGGFVSSTLVPLLPASAALVDRLVQGVVSEGDRSAASFTTGVAVLEELCRVPLSVWPSVVNVVPRILEFLAVCEFGESRSVARLVGALVALFPARADADHGDFQGGRRGAGLRFPIDLIRRVFRSIYMCSPDAETAVILLGSLAHLGVSGSTLSEGLSQAVNRLVVPITEVLSCNVAFGVGGSAVSVYALGRLAGRGSSVRSTPAISDLIDALLQDVVLRGRDVLKTQEIANMIYGLALLSGGHQPSPTLPAFLDSAALWVAERAAEFKPQELSISVYSLSQLLPAGAALPGGAVAAMLTRVGLEIGRRWSGCSAQAISNTVYGMARLNFRCEELLMALSGGGGLGLVGRLDEFTPQHISNVMYALGRVGYRDERLLREISEYIKSSGRLGQFRPQNISNTIYACWKLQYLDVGLFQKVAEHLPGRFSECVPQDISNIVFAYGELGFRDPAFFAAVKRWAQTTQMSTRDKSFLVSAFKRANIHL